MARARRLVVDSHDKLLDTFQQEALSLLQQTKVVSESLKVRNEQVKKLEFSNRQLELDLAHILKQDDYNDARIPDDQKEFKGREKLYVHPVVAYENEQRIQQNIID